MDNDEMRLLAGLAGQVNRDLQTSVKNDNKIVPQKFIKSLGIPTRQAGIRFNTQAPIGPAAKIPGMIEQPKAIPAGTEIVGTVPYAPDFIPIPEDLKKYVQAEEQANPQPVPQPQPTPQPDQQIITEPAPVPDITPAPNTTNSFEHQVLARLDRIEMHLGLFNEPKFKKAMEKVLLNERKRNKQSKKSKRPKVSGSLAGDPTTSQGTS